MITLSATDSMQGVAGTATAVTYTLYGDQITSADAFKILAQGQLANSTGSIYPATGGTQTLIKSIHLANTTGSSVSGVKLFINGSAASNQIITLTVPANGTAQYNEDGWKVYDSTGAGIVTNNVTLSGDVSGSGTSPITTTIATSAVTNAKLANMANLTVKGNTSGGSATPSDLATTGIASSVVLASAATIKPKDIEGRVFVDSANTQGWAGSDAGAWINSAYAYIHTTYTDNNGGVIELAAGSYSFSTPIVLANAGLMSIVLRGAGDGNGSTILNYTATTGACLSVGGGSGNDGGVQLENFTITGTAQGNGATAIQWGVTGTAGIAGATAKNVSIRRFTTGMNWATGSIAYAINLINCKVQQCTNGLVPFGEDNVMVGGLIGGCATGIAASGAAEMNLLGVAFDDNTTTALNMSNSLARFSLLGCRFENAGLGASSYITISNGSISMIGGALQEDNTTGTATGFVQATGGVISLRGVWLYSGGRVMTQVFNIASPTSYNASNIIVAPGASSPSTTLAVLTPAAYLGTITASSAALTATDTLIKSIPIPLNTLLIGSTFRIRAHGQYAATVSNAVSFRARLGINNSIADAQLAVVTTAAAGTTTTGFTVEFMVTIRSLGATAAVMANGFCFGLAASTTNPSNQTATVAVNSTVSNFLSLTAGPAAATSNLTFTNCIIEPVQLNSSN